MRFAICIPTYEMNGMGDKYLNILLNSISKQTFKDFEIIISDHSLSNIISETIKPWLESLPITYYKNEHKRGNASVNMNNCIKHTNAKYIKIMHQDDFFCEDDCLETINKKIESENSKWGVCASKDVNADSNDREERRIPYYYDEILSGINSIGEPSVSFFINDGIFFDENLIWINDCEIYYRLFHTYGPPSIIADKYYVAIRRWDGSVSSTITGVINEREISYCKKKYANITKSLVDIANLYHLDKGTKSDINLKPKIQSTTIYDKYFESIRFKPLNILEIGIGNVIYDNSLQMWEEYFPNSKVYGIDVKDCSNFNNYRIQTYIADQADRKQLMDFIKNSNVKFDIIIDDGGHMMKQQQVSFGFLFKYLKPGGLYWIEDIHSSFWPINGWKELYGNTIDINPERTNTTYDFVKIIVDNKLIKSEYLEESETSLLKDQIEESNLFNLPETEYGPNYLAYFKKKITNIKKDDWIYNLPHVNRIRKYSQFGEEGYIRYILNNIGHTDRFLVDIGCWDGWDDKNDRFTYHGFLSNTKYFIDHFGYTGLFIDGNSRGNISIKEEWITRENVRDILNKYNCPKEFTMLSIDLDGNDYYIIKELTKEFRPKLLICEVNRNIPLGISKTIKYDPNFTWKEDDYCGMSYSAALKMADSIGYRIIFQNDSANLYLLRKDLLDNPDMEIPINFQHVITHEHNSEGEWVEV